MSAAVTFHDRVGPERLSSAVEPMAGHELRALLESAVAETAKVALGQTEVEVEVTLCGDPEMERLHFDHMGERGPTDVLSFPLHEWEVDGTASRRTEEDGALPPGMPLLLGDVVIDVDQALRQSEEGGWSVAEELALLAIHGTLHLLGHDHADIEEEERMRAVEHHVLRTLHRRHRDVAWRPGSLFDRAGHAVSSGT
jgi:probable rRNA maturation factor